jgi:hypothetical protein
MLYKGVLKRVLPFFLTFAAGLFIASFFVSIASPSFSFPRRSHKHREVHRLRMENQDLRRSNSELRRQLEEARRNSDLRFSVDSDFPNFDPPPPPAPRAPRFER